MEIRIDYSYTKNMGKFESCKISAGLSKTIPDDKDPYKEMESEYYNLGDFVMNKVNELGES